MLMAERVLKILVYPPLSAPILYNIPAFCLYTSDDRLLTIT